MKELHVPVMMDEVLQYLDPQPNQNFIDATLGGGGHAREILKRIAPKGRILGIERDRELTALMKPEKNLIIEHGNFNDMASFTKKHRLSIQGILFDLGLNSWHLDHAHRGFSFLKDEPLDMRFDIADEKTAKYVVNHYSPSRLENVLYSFGEEQFAKRVVRAIVAKRKFRAIQTTAELVAVLKSSLPFWYKKRKTHFATRTFQALRIEVNSELENLQTGLREAAALLKKGGRLVIISFHSLEVRIIKSFFKESEGGKMFRALHKKAIRPSSQEIMLNNRARSAFLRAWEHI